MGYFVWKITVLRQKFIFFPISRGRPPPLDPPLGPYFIYREWGRRDRDRMVVYNYSEHFLKTLIIANWIYSATVFLFENDFQFQLFNHISNSSYLIIFPQHFSIVVLIYLACDIFVPDSKSYKLFSIKITKIITNGKLSSIEI